MTKPVCDIEAVAEKLADYMQPHHKDVPLTILRSHLRDATVCDIEAAAAQLKDEAWCMHGFAQTGDEAVEAFARILRSHLRDAAEVESDAFNFGTRFGLQIALTVLDNSLGDLPRAYQEIEQRCERLKEERRARIAELEGKK